MSTTKKIKLSSEIHCEVCDTTVSNKNYSAHLKSIAHKNKCSQPIGSGVNIIASAFNNRIVSYRITGHVSPTTSKVDILIEEFINSIKDQIINIIKEKIEEYSIVKVNFELFASFIKPAKLENEEAMVEVKSFIVPYQIIDKSESFEEVIQKLIDTLKKKLEEFQVSFCYKQKKYN